VSLLYGPYLSAMNYVLQNVTMRGAPSIALTAGVVAPR
jgi:hypothetical protein